MFTNLLSLANSAPSNPHTSFGSGLMLKMEKLSFQGSNEFTLEGTPYKDAAILFVVNGIMYFDEADVTYNADTKTFTWKESTFKLSETDRIMALYSEEIKTPATT